MTAQLSPDEVALRDLLHRVTDDIAVPAVLSLPDAPTRRRGPWVAVAAAASVALLVGGVAYAVGRPADVTPSPAASPSTLPAYDDPAAWWNADGDDLRTDLRPLLPAGTSLGTDLRSERGRLVARLESTRGTGSISVTTGAPNSAEPRVRTYRDDQGRRVTESRGSVTQSIACGSIAQEAYDEVACTQLRDEDGLLSGLDAVLRDGDLVIVESARRTPDLGVVAVSVANTVADAWVGRSPTLGTDAPLSPAEVATVVDHLMSP